MVWNSKMREEVLQLMDAARENPEAAGTPQDFRFKALQVGHTSGVSCLRIIQDFFGSPCSW